jgi:hypothetical protein
VDVFFEKNSKKISSRKLIKILFSLQFDQSKNVTEVKTFFNFPKCFYFCFHVQFTVVGRCWLFDKNKNEEENNETKEKKIVCIQ